MGCLCFLQSHTSPPVFPHQVIVSPDLQHNFVAGLCKESTWFQSNSQISLTHVALTYPRPAQIRCKLYQGDISYKVLCIMDMS